MILHIRVVLSSITYIFCVNAVNRWLSKLILFEVIRYHKQKYHFIQNDTVTVQCICKNTTKLVLMDLATAIHADGVAAVNTWSWKRKRVSKKILIRLEFLFLYLIILQEWIIALRSLLNAVIPICILYLWTVLISKIE